MEKRANKFHKSNSLLKTSRAVDELNSNSTPPRQSSSSNVETKSPSSNHQTLNPGIKKIDIDTQSYPTEMRRDYLFDNYVLVAPKRNKRHFDTNSNSKHRLFETAASPRLDNQQEVYSLKDKNGHWLNKVVVNAFPALTLDNAAAYGSQEIVIDTPLSNTQLGELDHDQIVNLLLTYQTRTKQLLSEASIKYVLIFKNEGFLSGASLAHAHTQIFALAMVPPRFTNEAKLIEAYEKARNSNPYEDIIDFEIKSQKRIVWEDDNFIAFCPYASIWPLEVWVMAKRSVSSVVDLSTEEIFSLAKPVKVMTSKLIEHEIDYNFYLHNGASKQQRFCIKFTPRSLSTWGGFEVSTGMVINSIPPEAAAKWYKSDS